LVLLTAKPANEIYKNEIPSNLRFIGNLDNYRTNGTKAFILELPFVEVDSGFAVAVVDCALGNNQLVRHMMDELQDSVPSSPYLKQ